MTTVTARHVPATPRDPGPDAKAQLTEKLLPFQSPCVTLQERPCKRVHSRATPTPVNVVSGPGSSLLSSSTESGT